MLRRHLLTTSFLALVAVLVQPAWAERPVTSKLLPKNTLLYVGVANAKDLSARWQKTAMGRMLDLESNLLCGVTR